MLSSEKKSSKTRPSLNVEDAESGDTGRAGERELFLRDS